MYTTRKKIQKEKGLKPSEFEDSVAQAFFDLENGNQELKSDLKDLFINNAFQMDVLGNRKAVVIHVPYRLRKPFKKIHARLLREPEKKAVASHTRCGSCCDKKNCEAAQEGFSCSAPPHKDSDCRS